MRKLAIDRFRVCIGFMVVLLCLLYAPVQGLANDASDANRIADAAETSLE